jgi:hypothetical protein
MRRGPIASAGVGIEGKIHSSGAVVETQQRDLLLQFIDSGRGPSPSERKEEYRF